MPPVSSLPPSGLRTFESGCFIAESAIWRTSSTATLTFKLLSLFNLTASLWGTLPASHLAACGDTVLSGCPTRAPWSRRSRTPGCCLAAPCRWSAIGGPSACGHTHLNRTHSFSLGWHPCVSFSFAMWFADFYMMTAGYHQQGAPHLEAGLEILRFM